MAPAERPDWVAAAESARQTADSGMPPG